MKPATGHLSEYYDQRYANGYQETLSGYEYARWQALRHFLRRVADVGKPEVVVDYGCGSGLYAPLWRELFPGAEIRGCDVSAKALSLYEANHPGLAAELQLVKDNRSGLESDSADLCVSVEVMEHVEDTVAYLTDVARLLRPGGVFVWTTPCANRYSLEHVYSSLTGRIRPTDEGYRVWTWEDPAHLRRLRTAEVVPLLRRAGLLPGGFRFRAHAFSFLCDRMIRRWPGRKRLWERMMLLDYALLRRLPNGASMIGWAVKPHNDDGM